MRFMTNPTPRLPPLFLVQGQSPRTASRIWLVFNGLVGKTAGVAPVSAADFAALARSSPWRWTALRFTARWPGDAWRAQELRAPRIARPARGKTQRRPAPRRRAGERGEVRSRNRRHASSLPDQAVEHEPNPGRRSRRLPLDEEERRQARRWVGHEAHRVSVVRSLVVHAAFAGPLGS